MYGALDISTSGLVAQRVRLDTIAGNIANKDATSRADSRPGPYRRRVVLLAPGNPQAGRDAPGVHVRGIVEDPSPPRLVWDPQHPDRIRSGPLAGYVRYPNVDLTVEMVNAIEAVRAYEANLTVAEATKSMLRASLQLLG